MKIFLVKHKNTQWEKGGEAYSAPLCIRRLKRIKFFLFYNVGWEELLNTCLITRDPCIIDIKLQAVYTFNIYQPRHGLASRWLTLMVLEGGGGHATQNFVFAQYYQCCNETKIPVGYCLGHDIIPKVSIQEMYFI